MICRHLRSHVQPLRDSWIRYWRASYTLNKLKSKTFSLWTWPSQKLRFLTQVQTPLVSFIFVNYIGQTASQHFMSCFPHTDHIFCLSFYLNYTEIDYTAFSTRHQSSRMHTARLEIVCASKSVATNRYHGG